MSTKPSLVELSVSPNYVRWGMWEAIREIIQNAKDADDLSHSMVIDYNPRLKTLSILNHNVKLGRETLVLGSSSKRDDASQRGEFGEGYKLALSTFLNLSCKVTIINADEIWEPFLKRSENFNAIVLALKFKANPKPSSDLLFKIEGISNEAWEDAKSKFLFLNNKSIDKIDIPFVGSILKGEEYKNKLFVKGIYVSNLPQDHWFGYDLSNVRLDRDRNLADPYSLKFEVKNIFKKAINSDLIEISEAFKILDNPSIGESLYFISDWEEGGDFHRKLRDFFISLHGENSIPVEGMGEAIEAQHYGLKGIIVSPALRTLLGKVAHAFDKVKSSKAIEPVKTYNLQDLSQEEMQNFLWATDLISKVEPLFDLNKVAIVDFRSPKIHGSFHSGYIRFAKQDLLNKRELIATAVHEAAHFYGEDGSVQHRDATERLFSEIICLK